MMTIPQLESQGAKLAKAQADAKTERAAAAADAEAKAEALTSVQIDARMGVVTGKAAEKAEQQARAAHEDALRRVRELDLQITDLGKRIKSNAALLAEARKQQLRDAALEAEQADDAALVQVGNKLAELVPLIETAQQTKRARYSAANAAGLPAKYADRVEGLLQQYLGHLDLPSIRRQRANPPDVKGVAPQKKTYPIDWSGNGQNGIGVTVDGETIQGAIIIDPNGPDMPVMKSPAV